MAVVSSDVQHRQLALLIPWSALGRLASVRVVSSMYIWLFVVPLIAKALSGSSAYAQLTIFGHPFTMNLRLPFSWQIFYFSAIAFSLANLLFYFRCPRIVKDHTSAAEFRGMGKGWGQLLDYRDDARYPEQDFKKLHDLVKEKKCLAEADRARIDPRGRFYYMHDPANRYYALFNAVYEFADHQRKPWLVSCNALYLVGFCLIGYVFLQNFLAVVKLLKF